MRRSLLLVGVGFAVLFLLLSIWKNWSSTPGPSGAETDRTQDSAIAEFWGHYHDATRLRTESLYEAATRKYKAALEFQPEHEESLYYLGNCLLEVGEYREAIRSFRHLVRLNPRSQRGFSQLGVTLSSLEPGAVFDVEEARQAFERSIELDPEESGPLLRLGALLLKLNRFEEALPYFEKAAGFASPEGIFWAGYVHFRNGETNTATEQFNRVLRIAARESQISTRGARVEGDTETGSRMPLTPLRKAELKSKLYLLWTDARSLDNSQVLGPPRHLHNPERVVDQTRKFGIDPDGRGAWGDYDGDGDQDLAVVKHSGLRLYRNDNSGLQEVRKVSGIVDIPGGWDLVAEDHNEDGLDDLYVVRAGFLGTGENSLLESVADRRGSFNFSDVTGRVGLGASRSTIRAVFANVVGDDRADLIEIGGTEKGPAIRIFEKGDAGFRERTQDSGVSLTGTAVDCSVGDIDGDRDLDLFVLRWRRSGVLFRNEGSGTFVDVTPESGLEGTEGSAYSSLFLDFNQDQAVDLLVGRYAPYEEAIFSLLNPEQEASPGHPLLFRNDGHGHFSEVSVELGLGQSSGLYEAQVSDFNHDGWPDLFFANGGMDPSRLEPSILLLNRSGERFERHLLVPGLIPSRAFGVSVTDSSESADPQLYLAGAGLFQVRF